MKCTKCNKDRYGLFFVFNYPTGEEDVICKQCFKTYLLPIRQAFYKFFSPFFDWLHLNNDELLEFQKSNEKTQSNRDTSTDETPNP
jgi:hypothetical protein